MPSPRMFFLCAAAALVVASCAQDSSSWYPNGAASIASSYELEDSSAKACYIAIKVVNQDSSRISSSSISLSVRTDQRQYFQTVTSDTAIIPRGINYINTTIHYALTTESLAPEGLMIVDQQFE